MYILSFQFFVSFKLFILHNIQSNPRYCAPKDFGASSQYFCFIYCLGFYPVIKGIVDCPFDTATRIFHIPYIVVSLHVSTMVETMVSIIANNPMIKPTLHRTKLSFKRREIIDQVVGAALEDIW